MIMANQKRAMAAQEKFLKKMNFQEMHQTYYE